MIVNVEFIYAENRLIITLPRKTIVLLYSSLPPGWETNAPLYEEFVKNYLNNQIEERTDAGIWYMDKGIKPNDPEYYNLPNTERQWYDSVTDEIVFVECVVTKVEWKEEILQYLVTIKNTSNSIPKV